MTNYPLFSENNTLFLQNLAEDAAAPELRNPLLDTQRKGGLLARLMKRWRA